MTSGGRTDVEEHSYRGLRAKSYSSGVFMVLLAALAPTGRAAVGRGSRDAGGERRE